MASLNDQLKTSKSEFDKLKFARDAYTIGRHPSIKDGLGFKREVKNLTSHKAPISTKEKGKAPMASSIQKNHAFMYNNKIVKVLKTSLCEDNACKTHKPGEIISVEKDGIKVMCGDCAITLKTVKPEGKPEMPAYAWSLGSKIKRGDIIGC